MNIKEYISSGIVESYVLGLADATERAEFESMCAEHAEVKAARDNFEVLLEQQAFMNVIQPSKEVGNKIFAEIEVESYKSSSGVIPFGNNKMGNDGKLVALLRRMRYVVAAAVILLVASTALNFYFYNQSRDNLALYQSEVARSNQLANSNQGLQASLDTFGLVLNDPNMTIIKMPGSNVPKGPAPNSLATVYWNKDNREVYLFANNMPIPAAGKQYQLWAIVDGKPVDAGVFNINRKVTPIKMKPIPNAQAFAITLEREGGSPTPTMDQMYVLGPVKT